MLTKWVYKVGPWIAGFILCLLILSFAIYSMNWIAEHGNWTLGNVLGFVFAFSGAAIGLGGSVACAVQGIMEISER